MWDIIYLCFGKKYVQYFSRISCLLQFSWLPSRISSYCKQNLFQRCFGFLKASFYLFVSTNFISDHDENIDVTGTDSNDRHMTPYYNNYGDAFYPLAGQETLYECSARLLFMAVRWAKNLPSFANLPFRDQVKTEVYCTFAKNHYLQERKSLV